MKIQKNFWKIEFRKKQILKKKGGGGIKSHDIKPGRVVSVLYINF